MTEKAQHILEKIALSPGLLERAENKSQLLLQKAVKSNLVDKAKKYSNQFKRFRYEKGMRMAFGNTPKDYKDMLRLTSATDRWYADLVRQGKIKG